MLSGMRQLLQPVEPKKSRRPFNRMHGAEDLAQQSGVVGPRLELRQAALHAVKPFLALRNKLFGQVVHICYIGREPLTISAPRLAIASGTR
jgi:hypothetical protein